jgi:hypothetical protein
MLPINIIVDVKEGSSRSFGLNPTEVIETCSRLYGKLVSSNEPSLFDVVLLMFCDDRRSDITMLALPRGCLVVESVKSPFTVPNNCELRVVCANESKDTTHINIAITPNRKSF